MNAPLRIRIPLFSTLLFAVSLCTVLAAVVPTPIASQLISLKTVPVATGDQFLTLPSDKLGMGGVAIALDDAWLDPFVNPAKGSLIEESALLGRLRSMASRTAMVAAGLFRLRHCSAQRTASAGFPLPFSRSREAIAEATFFFR